MSQDRWAVYERFRKGLYEILEYVPSPPQEQFHRSRVRTKLLAGGERAGKSLATAIEAYTRSHFTRDGRPGVFWVVGPDYIQARKEFEYVVEMHEKMGRAISTLSMPRGPSSAWTLITKDGTQWATRTSKDERKIASEAVDGIIMSEAAQQTYSSYLKCRGRIAERRGWIILSGTFEGSVSYYVELYERWRADNKEKAAAFSIPTWTNEVIYPGGRFNAEIAALEISMPHDLFMERIGAKPMKPEGLVFKEYSSLIHSVPLRMNPELPVEIAIDPGYNGAYSVLAIQLDGNNVNIIDEIYERKTKTRRIIAMCKQRPWWHLVPKQSSAKSGGVIDIAARQHNADDSHIEIWLQDGGIALRSRPVGIREGITAVRSFLLDDITGNPRMFFNEVLSAGKDVSGHPMGIIGEFGAYKYRKWADGRPTTDLPIDQYNHACKALGYWLYDTFGPVGERLPLPEPVTRSYWQ